MHNYCHFQPDLCVLPVPCQSLLRFRSLMHLHLVIFIADAVYQSYLVCIVCYFVIHSFLIYNVCQKYINARLYCHMTSMCTVARKDTQIHMQYFSLSY